MDASSLREAVKNDAAGMRVMVRNEQGRWREATYVYHQRGLDGKMAVWIETEN